jgi:hypothetical protein
VKIQFGRIGISQFSGAELDDLYGQTIQKIQAETLQLSFSLTQL